jgi:hypothetical protein
MKITSITVTAEEKRSANYQSVGNSASVTIEVSDGDDLAKVYDDAQRTLSLKVAAANERDVQKFL